MSTWFGASQFFKATHQLPSAPETLWEERVVLVQARDEAEARALADKIGRDSEHEYMVAAPERHMLRWRYRGTERVYEILSETPAHGVEVFSRFLEPELAARLLSTADAVTPDWYRDIKRIEAFLREWNPIGIGDDLAEGGPAHDEYDSYAPPLYSLLARGASETELTAHLADLAQNRMGAVMERAAHQAMAAKIHAWWARRQES